MAMSFLKWLGSWACGDNGLPQDLQKRQTALEARIERQQAVNPAQLAKRKAALAGSASASAAALFDRDSFDKDPPVVATTRSGSATKADEDEEMKRTKDAADFSNVLSPQAAHKTDGGMIEEDDPASAAATVVVAAGKSDNKHKKIADDSESDDPLADIDSGWVNRPRAFAWLDQRKQFLLRAKMPKEEQIRLWKQDQQKLAAQRNGSNSSADGSSPIVDCIIADSRLPASSAVVPDFMKKMPVPPLLLGAACTSALMAPVQKLKQETLKRSSNNSNANNTNLGRAKVAPFEIGGTEIAPPPNDNYTNYSNGQKRRSSVDNTNNNSYNNHSSSRSTGTTTLRSEASQPSSLLSTRPSAEAAAPGAAVAAAANLAARLQAQEEKDGSFGISSSDGGNKDVADDCSLHFSSSDDDEENK